MTTCDHARGSLERCHERAQFVIVFKGFSYFYCSKHAVEIETDLNQRGEQWRRKPVAVKFPKENPARQN